MTIALQGDDWGACDKNRSHINLPLNFGKVPCCWRPSQEWPLLGPSWPVWRRSDRQICASACLRTCWNPSTCPWPSSWPQPAIIIPKTELRIIDIFLRSKWWWIFIYSGAREARFPAEDQLALDLVDVALLVLGNLVQVLEPIGKWELWRVPVKEPSLPKWIEITLLLKRGSSRDS